MKQSHFVPKVLAAALSVALFSLSSYAAEQKEFEDMSDPLAVFSQAGIGYTDKGLNLKFAQAYDSKKENILALRALEIKGIYGGVLGWSDDASVDDSVDSLRYRTFEVDITTG